MNPDKSERGAAEGAGIGGGACLTVPLGAEVDDAAVEAAVQRAFREQRAFAFAPRHAWQGGDAGERQRLAVAVRTEAVAAAAPDSAAARERLQRDARLMQRLGNAVRLTHDLLTANEDGSHAASAPRRVVLIRELPGARFLVRTGRCRGAGAGRAGTGRRPGADHLPRAAAVRPGGRGAGRRLRTGAGGAASGPEPGTARHRDRLLARRGGRRTAARRHRGTVPRAARAGARIRTARPGAAAAAPPGARHRRPPAGVPAPVERAPRRRAARLRRRHRHGGDAQPGAPRAARQAAWRRRHAARGDAPAGRRGRP